MQVAIYYKEYRTQKKYLLSLYVLVIITLYMVVQLKSFTFVKL